MATSSCAGGLLTVNVVFGSPTILGRENILRKHILRVLLLPTLLIALLTVFGFAQSPAAHAGGNGQLIGVVTYGNSASIFGFNQNHVYINKHCISTPSVPPSWSNNTSTGWWFESYNNTNVTVYTYSNSGCPSGQANDVMTCYVPPSQGPNYTVFNFTNHSCYPG